MYIVMDMGTSNTRISLCADGKVTARKKGGFGAGSSKAHGKPYLFESLKALIGELLAEGGVSEKDVECVFVSGMAGSEMGLCDVERIALPADVYKLADNLKETRITEITDIPFVFVPGLKKTSGEKLMDVMRGEETEVAGILESASIGEAVLVLPGTHNKIISVNADGEITDFYTTFSGELLNGLVSGSILAGQVSHDFEISERDVLGGAEFAKKNGLNAAVFRVRVMALNGENKNVLTSFLYGAVISEDVELTHRIASGRKIYIGGRESLKRVYGLLLGEDEAVMLDASVADNAVAEGLSKIYRLYKARRTRNDVLAAIEREKLIAIVRCPEKESFARAMRAIYDGGVRLAEITFDRSGKYPKEYTAEMIRLLIDELGGDMLVGAGTVMSPEEVMLAYNAGASYIISPNCDPEVIGLTRKLGLVSIPAAFTATEIGAAIKHGADYIKLFPADGVGDGYVKAVKAPLADAKLLAVGGVSAENAGEWLKKGFCGVGVGSNLYNNKLIEAGDFAALTELAKKFVKAIGQRFSPDGQ